MADFVNQIRKKLGLEPKRDRTETGKVPNEIKINRLQNEIAGYPVPVIPTQGVVFPDSQHVGDDKNIKAKDEKDKINLRRRRAIKRWLHAVDPLGEDMDPSTKPNPTATVAPVPTANANIKKAKTMQELFGPTTPGEHGSPKYGDVMYELKPAKKKKNLKEYIISEGKEKDKSKTKDSDSYGKLSELLFAKHLNDGKHCDHYRSAGKTPKEMHDHHSRLLFGEEYSKHPDYKHLNEAAKKAAEEHREYLKKTHGIKHISRVVWTSQSGDHEKETGVHDPASKADVIITGHDGDKSKSKQVAVSVKAKIPGSTTKDTNWANHGLNTLSAHSGEDLEGERTIKSLKDEHNKLVQKKLNPKNEKISREELHKRYKEYRKKNGEVNDITASSGQISQHIAKTYAKGLGKKLKTDEDHIAHIKRAVSAAGQKKGGDPETGKTHLHQDVVAIHPSKEGNHHTEILPFSEHVHGHLKEYHDYKVEHGGNGVAITATHKKTGKRHTVHRTQIYAGGLPETTQQRTQTTLPQFKNYESSKKSLKEEVSLLEHVQSVISEAKNIPIGHAINHLDIQARHHARKYQDHNKAMSSIVSNRKFPDGANEYAKHAEEAMWHHRQYKARLAQLEAGTKLEENQKKGITVALPVDIDGKKYSAVNGQAYVHSTTIMGRWNTQKRQMRKALKPGAHHDKIIATLEKHKNDSLDEATRKPKQTKAIDRQGKKCTNCGKGTYQVRDLNGDIHGELNCTKCYHWVRRYSSMDAKNEDLDEALKTPRKGTVAYYAAMQRKQNEKDPEYIKKIEKIGNKNHMFGNAKVIHKDEEDLQENKKRGADSEGHKRPTEQGAGLTRKGVEAYRRENPGSKLSTAVTTPPSKLKPGSKAANRRKSFCARMSGVDGPMKDEKGRPTRKAMSLRRWNCEANEILNALVEAKKMKGKDPCWDNHEMVGTKEKNGRTVPNCVPKG